jgi:UDPglucose 6-dehydrogenase
MKLAVIGLWHLGTVVSTGLSTLKKKQIYCFDEDTVIDDFKKKKIPINEKNIENILKKNINKSIFFSSDFSRLKNFKTIWITYDAKINESDYSNFDNIFKKLKKIFKYLSKETLIIISTQLSIGSIKKLENYDKLKLKKKLRFVYIPENLRLGNGLDIFLNSSDLTIGLRKKSDKKQVLEAIKGINSKKNFVSIETAEMTKHVINSYLACSIAFINEISKIASLHNVSFSDLEKSVKTDKRISPDAYLKPGNSFSGGTLARDLNFLIKEGKENSYDTKLLRSIITSNNKHSQWVENIINEQKNIDKKKILQIGLSYVSGTTTLRRSLPFEIFKRLKNKYYIKIFDEFLKKKSNEVLKIQDYFESSKSKSKFNIIVIFNNDNKFNIIKKFTNKNTLIIDINNFYKKDCLKHKIKYKSLEDELK